MQQTGVPAEIADPTAPAKSGDSALIIRARWCALKRLCK